MKHEELLVTIAIAAGVAFSAPVVSAQSTKSPEARALAAAEQSPDALRHFVDRTRMIYALNYNDYHVTGERVPDADIASQTDGYSEAASAPAEADQSRKDLEEAREQLDRDMQRE
jgi:hypothetical protein